jgi:hypothetical protein
VIDPPGTISISDSTYIDATPVSNYMYLEMLDDLQTTNSKYLSRLQKHEIREYLELKDDQTIFEFARTLKNMVVAEISLDEYRYNTVFYNYPVIILNPKQAWLFCKWRTIAVNHHIDQSQKKTVSYRLPTIDEYEYAQNLFLSKNKFQFVSLFASLNSNQRVKFSGGTVFEQYDVSEFTLDGKVLLDSLIHDKFMIKNDLTGFRCFCEIR